MWCKTLLSFLLCFCIKGSFSQNYEPIEADRPDQTESVSTTPKNYLQEEFGLSWERTNKEMQTFSVPSLLLKYGINDRFELRFSTEWITQKTKTETLKGFTPLAVGFKVRVCEEKGILPQTSFLAHLSIPKAASEVFTSKYSAPDFRFTMQHSLTDKISLAYNIGAEWDGETPQPTFIYTITSGITFEKIGCYLELYGFAPQSDKADHRVDAGISYRINEDFMVDLSGGVGLTKNAPDHYFSLGFSHRFNLK